MDRLADDKIRAARTKVSAVRPWFSHAVYAYILVQVPPDSKLYTMGVDQYKRLYYNPRFVHDVSIDELVTCIIHELGHSLRDHHLRARAMGVTEATQEIANIAQDLPINADIRNEVNQIRDLPPLPDIPVPDWLVNKAKLLGVEIQNPSPPCYPEQYGFEEGEPWEVYYQKLLEHIDTVGAIPAHDCGSGAHGNPRPWEDGDPSTPGATEGVSDADWEDVKSRVAEAIVEHHQRRRGTVPGSWVEWAGSILQPKRIPWDQELSGQLRWGIADTIGHLIHTYRRPSRRSSVMRDFTLPSTRNPKPFVCMVGDTSGSMSSRDLDLVRGVVEDICQAMGAQVAFLSTDAKVHGGIQRVHEGRRVKLAGRGGTDMRVGIQYALDNLRPRPDVIVCVTDCGTLWPERKLDRCRLIVAAVGEDEMSIANVPSWARLVRVDPENTSRKSD